MQKQDKPLTTAGRQKQRRGGLGRGLGSLIPTSPSDADVPSTPVAVGDSTLQTVPVISIRANPWQPRMHLQQDQLEELAASISTHGLMQPLVVSGPDGDATYTLIAGERRWRAATLAGLESVPVVVMAATPQEMLELAIVENVVRADLSPLEEAHAYRRLIDDFELTQAEVAERVGKSRVAVTNTLRLLNAPEQVQQAIVDGEISEGHARAMLGLPSIAEQLSMLAQVRARQLNVRQTESAVRGWGQKQTRREIAPPDTDPEHLRIEGRLRDALATRVTLKSEGTGGKIVIDYSSDEHLQAILSRLIEDDLW